MARTTELVAELHAHLQEVLDDPSRPLNEKLLKSIDRQVTGAQLPLPLPM